MGCVNRVSYGITGRSFADFALLLHGMSLLVPGTADADVTANIALAVVLMRLAYSIHFGHGRGSASERRESLSRASMVVLSCAVAICATVMNLGLCNGNAAHGSVGWARRSLRLVFTRAAASNQIARSIVAAHDGLACPPATERGGGEHHDAAAAAVSALGHLLILSAMALLWGTHAAMGASWTPFIAVKRGHRLVTWGPFAYVRHPMYSSACLLAAGFALALRSIAVAMAWAPLLWRLAARVPQEEELLVAHYSAAYRSYKKRVVYRIVPFMW